MSGYDAAGQRVLERERRNSSTLGRASLLVTTAAVFWVSLAWIGRGLDPGSPAFRDFLLLESAASGLIVFSAFLLVRGRRLAYWTLPPGMLAGLAPLVLRAEAAPEVVFLSGALAAAVTALGFSRPFGLERVRLRRLQRPGEALSPAVLLSGMLSLIVVSLAGSHDALETALGRYATVALLITSSLIASFSETVEFRSGGISRWRFVALGSSTALGLAFASIPEVCLPVLGCRQFVALLRAARAHESYEDVVRFLWRRPALLVVSTFIILGLVGGLILSFPVATTRPIEDLDALFTAVSASCVTGLTVLDTSRDFTLVGQGIILLLIQVGGLGIMTISAVAVLFLGGGLPSEEELVLGEIVGATSRGAILRLMKAIVTSTLAIEGVGAVILALAFLAEGEAPASAAWKGLFHSIAAFCNAGFALQSDSLVSYSRSPLILHTIAALIVLGGIGFGAIMGLYDLARRRNTRLTLHVKLVLAMTALLLVSGTGLYLVFEWDASLAGMDFFSKLNNAWLQGVTPRTAGFNSVGMGLLRPGTILLFIVLMFIGASPVSTGGGIKTSTALVLLLAVRAVVTQSGDPEAFGRRIPVATVARAAAVATLSVAVVGLGTLVLLATQTAPFASLVFEAVSAFGTVGLSLDLTSTLDSLGKTVIIFLMLAGRTGPLTLVLLFHEQSRPRLRYPKEDVIVG